jgi:phosphate:Na+ symporter
MFDIWKVLAGTAIFVLGMNFLEEAIRQLSGRKFKLFLRKQTSHPVAAIGGGAIVTGIMQSSSVVNLMVLALVGAGTIPMKNALAIILGANVGTTLSTWIIAAVGFEFNIESIAFPAIAVAGILRAMFKSRADAYNWFGFLLGLGFLFMGLEMMKSGMAESIRTFDLGHLNQYPVFIYLLAGLVITSLIQSSSATIAIVLSALYAGAIDLYAATALVLGSEVGTTLKLLIAAAGREPAMKRVALGNFLFNIISSLVIFIFLAPVNKLITGIFGITNPLLALAFFQTFINALSILLFYPLLNLMGRFLENRFRDEQQDTRFISRVLPTDTDLAIIAMTNETWVF